MTQVNPRSARIVAAPGVLVDTPGLVGEVRPVTRGPARTRTRTADELGALGATLSHLGFSEQAAFEIDAVEEAPRGVAGTRSGDAPQADLAVFEVEAPGGDLGQVLLVRDEETGALSWLIADEAQKGQALDELEAATTRAGASTRTYHLPPEPDLPAPPAASGAAQSRGLVGKVVRKVVKVLVYHVAVGAATKLVERVESAKRPHALRDVTTGAAPQGPERLLVGDRVGDDRWRDLNSAGGDRRTLLMIHGTNSQTETGFWALPPSRLKALHEVYSGRVVAFDHPTLSVSPDDNVRAFLDAVPRGVRLDLDIVCHSRGGLVARHLSERPHDAVTVSKVVFVATPNDGTPLANAEHVGAFLDTYTSLLSVIPDNLVTTWLEVLVEAVKEVGKGYDG